MNSRHHQLSCRCHKSHILAHCDGFDHNSFYKISQHVFPGCVFFPVGNKTKWSKTINLISTFRLSGSDLEAQASGNASFLKHFSQHCAVLRRSYLQSEACGHTGHLECLTLGHVAFGDHRHNSSNKKKKNSNNHFNHVESKQTASPKKNKKSRVSIYVRCVSLWSRRWPNPTVHKELRWCQN